MTRGCSLHPRPKAAGDPDLKDAFDDFLGAFGAFREANDERLAEIERKLSADVVTEEKVERINAALDSQKRLLDRLVLKGSRPELGSPGPGRALEASEHKAAFEAYVRSGEMTGLKRLEAKAVSTVTSPDSGYLVPPEDGSGDRRDGSRSSRRSARSPASARCPRTSTGSRSRRPASPPAGWARPTRATETNTPTLVELEYPAMELYAMPAATQTLLDDSADQHRPVDRERSGDGLRRAGRHRLRHRRRRQEAEGLPLLHHGRGGELGVGQDRLRHHRRRRRTSPAARTPPTSWSTRLCAEGRLSAERALG